LPYDEPPCPAEEQTLAYLAGDLSGAERAGAEHHVAVCDACREVAALLVRLTSTEVSPEEAQLLDEIGERTEEAARRLYREKYGDRRRRQAWVKWGALAASVALAAAVGLAIWQSRPGVDSDVGRGMAALHAATHEQRPIELRLTGMDYAPHRELRSANGGARQVYYSRALLEKAVNANPTPEARHALGQALVASGDYDGAVAQLERARDEAPRDAGILSDLGAARAAAGDGAGAEADLTRALDIDPSRPEALFNRAIVRERAGRLSDAAADLHTYLTVDDASPWAAEVRNRLQEIESKTK